MPQDEHSSLKNSAGSADQSGVTDYDADRKLSHRRAFDGLKDAGHFLRHWAERPRSIGAVSPSGRFLARAMAAPVPLDGGARIVELGPGTGSVTKALLGHGVPPERLVLIEYSADFCALLRKRFPGVMVIEGDAYAAEQTLATHHVTQVGAFVSSLPLFSQPLARRIALLRAVAKHLPPGADFIQFSYALVPPVRACDCEDLFQIEVSPWILRNIPPARVWRYQLKT